MWIRKKSTQYIDHIRQEIITHLDKVASAEYQPLEEPKNWHQVDSLLALVIGFRHQNGIARRYGDSDEGVIYV